MDNSTISTFPATQHAHDLEQTTKNDSRPMENEVSHFFTDTADLDRHETLTLHGQTRR